MSYIEGMKNITDEIKKRESLGSFEQIPWFVLKNGEAKKIKIMTRPEEFISASFHFYEGLGFVKCKGGIGGKDCPLCKHGISQTRRVLFNVFDYQEGKVKHALLNSFIFDDIIKVFKRKMRFDNDFTISRIGIGTKTRYEIEEEIGTSWNEQLLISFKKQRSMSPKELIWRLEKTDEEIMDKIKSDNDFGKIDGENPVLENIEEVKVEKEMTGILDTSKIKTEDGKIKLSRLTYYQLN